MDRNSLHQMNVQFCLCFMLLNQMLTSSVFFHLLTVVAFLMLLLILYNIFLLIFQFSDQGGLISLNDLGC